MTLLDETQLEAMRALSAKFGDGTIRPTGPNGRVRVCTRCESLASDYQRHTPDWRPPMAHSWTHGGYRYWSALCRSCGEMDNKKRLAAMQGRRRPSRSGEQRPQTAMQGRTYVPKAEWAARGGREQR